MMKLWILPALQTIEVRRHETAKPEHYTSYWQIHDNKVHEASLGTVAGLGGDIIASIEFCAWADIIGDTNSQSEKA